MSRREDRDRDSDSKRHRSRFDREPGPKRSRDGKPATEKPSGNADLGTRNHSERDKKPQSRLRDALPLEATPMPDSKVETQAGGKEIDRKAVTPCEGTKHSSDPAELPRSRSFSQRDERGSDARQVDRSFSRGDATERGWWRDSKDRYRERATNRKANSDMQPRDEKSQPGKDENSVRRHDGFSKMEAENPPPPSRKRPSFREKKIPVDPESTEKAGTEPIKPSQPDRPVLESGRREERGGHNSRHSDRLEKQFSDFREPNRAEAQRSGFSSRESYGGNGNYRGRERFNGGRQAYHPGGVRVEKWKHDMFQEANRSPTPKNEEDQIAKVEALLSS